MENKATLTTIVSTLDIISRKFEQVDSQLEAYELDRNRPLMDQKTIDDRERLKDLGIGKISENHDNPSPPSSDNSLSMASPVVRTHQKFGPKTNLAKELEKKSGVKRTLDEEFGSDAAFKRKEKAEDKKKETEARKKEAEAKKKVAEAKKKEAELKKKQEAELQKQKTGWVKPDVEDSSLADIIDEAVAEQNEFAQKSDVENSEVVRSAIIKDYREKMF
ncbi:hypothetical protein HID58_002433, partial [Brassica napus]